MIRSKGTRWSLWLLGTLGLLSGCATDNSASKQARIPNPYTEIAPVCVEASSDQLFPSDVMLVSALQDRGIPAKLYLKSGFSSLASMQQRGEAMHCRMIVRLERSITQEHWTQNVVAKGLTYTDLWSGETRRVDISRETRPLDLPTKNRLLTSEESPMKQMVHLVNRLFPDRFTLFQE